MVKFLNQNCLEYLKSCSDNQFDLAIVDPPYGDGGKTRFGGLFDKYKPVVRTGGSWAKKYGKGIIDWDIAPSEEYFIELFRVSKKQIIWGGNYFKLPPSRNFIIWEKLSISENFSMAMIEYAWTNIEGNAKMFKFAPQNKDRFHPTQKPVELYKWLLQKYAKNNDLILDTHGGSGSIAIACHDLGFDLTITEINKDYFDKMVNRYNEHIKQFDLFDNKEIFQKELF